MKVSDSVVAFNMDGREYIRKSLDLVNDKNIWSDIKSKKIAKIISINKRKGRKEDFGIDQIQEPTDEFKQFKHYIMNLPATAIEFLNAFAGLYKGLEHHIQPQDLPLIHCHLFTKAEDKKRDAIKVSYNL